MSQLQRTFIGIFGRRNQGKSALINAIAGQDTSVITVTAESAMNLLMAATSFSFCSA